MKKLKLRLSQKVKGVFRLLNFLGLLIVLNSTSNKVYFSNFLKRIMTTNTKCDNLR